MSRFDYWQECIGEAMCEAGVPATSEQIDVIAHFVDSAHENFGMAFGYDAIPNPVETEATRKLARMEKEKQDHEHWILRTKPCRSCTTTGWVLDGWGRQVTCLDCSGKGRV